MFWGPLESRLKAGEERREGGGVGGESCEKLWELAEARRSQAGDLDLAADFLSITHRGRAFPFHPCPPAQLWRLSRPALHCFRVQATRTHALGPASPWATPLPGPRLSQGHASPRAPPLFSWRLACPLHTLHPLDAQHLVPRVQDKTKIHCRAPPCLN